MKLGIIGLGSICEKAYLPVITAKKDIELVFCTRNREKLEQLAKTYRVKEYVTTIEELINLKVEAAFVHTATESHVEIVEKLLKAGVHVYVDKPISYNYDESVRLVELSKATGKLLMVGFNRRFAPMYKSLRDLNQPDIIIVQKNRVALPSQVRPFIMDDFIHVLDTMRFLMGGKIDSLKVNSLKKDGLLYNVVVTLANERTTAIGIMNRDNGTAEEVVEYMSSGNKVIVKDLVNTTKFKNNSEELIKFKDWDPMLYRRGFYGVVESFLEAVQKGKGVYPSIEDSLITHKLCEEIIEKL